MNSDQELYVFIACKRETTSKGDAGTRRPLPQMLGRLYSKFHIVANVKLVSLEATSKDLMSSSLKLAVLYFYSKSK